MLFVSFTDLPASSLKLDGLTIQQVLHNGSSEPRETERERVRERTEQVEMERERETEDSWFKS